MKIRLRIKDLFGLSLFVLCTTCSGKSGTLAKQLACSLLGAGVNKSSLTVGLSQAFLSSLKGEQSLSLTAAELDGKIQETLNGALETAGLDEQLNIKSVASVPKQKNSDDGVRFLELGGNLAPGVNFASSILKSVDFQAALGARLNLQGSSSFDFIEDSFNVYASGSTSLAADRGKQWAYQQSDAAKAQTIAAALPNAKEQVVVAVLDTGVALNHDALRDNLYKVDGQLKGYDFANNDPDPDDDQGHGTHCAGIIAAQNVGAEGMTGVGELLAPGKVKIMPVKVLGQKGGSTEAVNKGIRYAMAEGADVISMSLGGGMEFKDFISSNGAESKVIRDALDAGVILVVAAGNENCPLGGKCEQKSLLVLKQAISEYTVIPCSYNGTICVGASDPDATLAAYSNYPSSEEQKGIDPARKDPAQQRRSPDTIAPGSAIYATYLNNSYKSLDGTSMATPYVAGLAAIFKLKLGAAHQNAAGSPQQTFRRLLQEAELSLKEEDSSTRSFVGQVDLAYFMEKLREHAEGAAPAASKPELQPIAGVEDSQSSAPNALSALCQ